MSPPVSGGGENAACAPQHHTPPIFFPRKENGRCDRPKERRLHCKRAARRAAMLADCTAHSAALPRLVLLYDLPCSYHPLLRSRWRLCCLTDAAHPLRSLGGPRGPFSHVREWPPFPYPPRVRGKCSTTYKWSISAHSTVYISSRCRRGRDRCGRSSGPCGAVFSPCRRRRWRRRCRRPRARA